MPYVEVRSYKEFKELKGNRAFSSLMAKAIDIRQQIDELDAALVEIKDELEAELIAADVAETVEYKGWHLRVIDKPGRKSIDKKKLMALLGPKAVEIMKKATVVGKSSHYVQLVSPRDKKESEGEE
jgi:hypothetical protein